MKSIQAFFASMVAALLRAVLLVAGLVFAFSLVVSALLIGMVVVAAALLTGRRPSLRGSFRMPQRPGWGRFGGRRPGVRPSSSDDVVDAVVREVPDASPRLDAGSRGEPPRPQP